MSASLALLCAGEAELSVHRAMLEALGPELESLLLAATEINPPLVAAAARLHPRLRLISALHPQAGLTATLQSALLACPSSMLLALDASRPSPPIAALQRLKADPRPGNALVFESSGELQLLPGRFRRGCLGPLGRALRAGEISLPALLGLLRASRMACGPGWCSPPVTH